MNILYISASDPRSTRNGGEQRHHFVWEGLKKLGDVYTIIPVNHYSEERQDGEKRIYRVSFERRWTFSWFVARIFNRLLPGIDLPTAYGLHRLKKLNLPKLDVCIVRPARWAAMFRLWRIAPTCVDMDDIPLAEFDIETKMGHNSLARRVRRIGLSYEQRAVCKKASRIWIADEAEMSRFPGLPVSFMPNIPVPPLPDFGNVKGSDDTLVFIGFLAHGPNQVALNWFLTTIWKGLKERFPKIRFEIVGGGLPEKYKREWSQYEDVVLRGFVQDLRPYYEKALAIVTPMQIGSGTCLKVLEALRMGRVLISTQQGLRGIRPEDRIEENGILTFSDLKTLVHAIEKLQSSDRIPLQQGAIALVERRNTQRFIDESLRRELCELNVLDA